jgi:hypothetical protein
MGKAVATATPQHHPIAPPKGTIMTNQNFAPVPPAAQAPAARPFYKKKRYVLPAGMLLLGIMLGSCSGGSKEASDVRAAAPSSSAAAAPAVSSAPATTTPAPAAPTPAVPAPAAPAVGTPFTVNMRNGNAARITVLSAVRTDSVSASLHTPAKNGSYLVLDVLWETETGETSSNPFYFSAKDSNGRKVDLNLFADGQLASGQVAVGDKARGFIAFDAAPGPVTVMISDPLMQEAARIQIAG